MKTNMREKFIKRIFGKTFIRWDSISALECVELKEISEIVKNKKGNIILKITVLPFNNFLHNSLEYAKAIFKCF